MKVRMFLSADALGVGPPGEHVDQCRAEALRAFQMVPKKHQATARGSMGVCMAVKSLHRPQAMGLFRGKGGKAFIFWGSLVNVTTREPLSNDDLKELAKRRGESWPISVRVDGSMSSPAPMIEPVEDVMSAVIRGWSCAALDPDVPDDDLRQMEEAADGMGGKGGS